jgi:hypothetical protein
MAKGVRRPFSPRMPKYDYSPFGVGSVVQKWHGTNCSLNFTLYSPCISITNQKSKNQHMHCILTSKSITPTYVSTSRSHLQGVKILHMLDIH